MSTYTNILHNNKRKWNRWNKINSAWRGEVVSTSPSDQLARSRFFSNPLQIIGTTNIDAKQPCLILQKMDKNENILLAVSTQTCNSKQ